MKNLKDIITERLHITKQTSIYRYSPKTKEELREILEERLAKDKNADLNDIDVSQITDMGHIPSIGGLGLFECLDQHNIKLNKWDVSKVTNMLYMFCECKNFDADLGEWDVSNVQDMYKMFYKCEKFKGKGLENWDVKKNIYMSFTFGGCKSLKNKPSWYGK